MSASPSASQEPLIVDAETPSESHSRSASGVLEPPRIQPTQTPTGEGIDADRQEEVLIAATAMEREFDELPLDVVTPEQDLVAGDTERDIQSWLYLAYPEIVEAREYIDPIIHKFMSSLKPDDTIENEDRMMDEFTPTCFNETYDQLMNRIDPLDDDIQLALGKAVEAFPMLLPKVFKTYRRIGKPHYPSKRDGGGDNSI